MTFKAGFTPTKFVNEYIEPLYSNFNTWLKNPARILRLSMAEFVKMTLLNLWLLGKNIMPMR